MVFFQQQFCSNFEFQIYVLYGFDGGWLFLFLIESFSFYQMLSPFCSLGDWSSEFWRLKVRNVYHSSKFLFPMEEENLSLFLLDEKREFLSFVVRKLLIPQTNIIRVDPWYTEEVGTKKGIGLVGGHHKWIILFAGFLLNLGKIMFNIITTNLSRKSDYLELALFLRVVFWR